MTSRSGRILNLVIENYIRLARPVPSSMIAKQLRISSATVRNEYIQLEQKGYLVQPHTSAGRIPTALGYRRYASKFIPPQRLPKGQRQFLEMRLQGIHGDNLLQQVAHVTAELSGYAVVVHLPADDKVRTLEIHFSRLPDARLLALVVLETGLIRQLALNIHPSPAEEALRQAEDNVQGLALPLDEMPKALKGVSKHTTAEVARTLNALAEAWPKLSPPRFFSRGLSNLLDEPESIDPNFVRCALKYIEQPPAFSEESESVSADVSDGLKLELEDTLALISASLSFGTSLILLGPMRMRYPETLTIAQGVMEIVSGNFNLN